MLARMTLGGEFDFATAGEVDSSVDRVLDFLNKDDKPRPKFNVITQAFQFSSPATTVLDVGSPPTGSIWNVLGFTLCGSDDATQSSAGTVGFYIGPRQATGAPALGHLRVPRLVVPTSQSFTKGTHWCHSNDNLILNLVGLTGPTQLVANFFVAEWRENDVLDITTR